MRLARVLVDIYKCILSGAIYKICACSFILGEYEPFMDYKGFSIIFPKILDAI